MNYDKQKNRIEERVYSVTMTEEELSLFSEFLEQREYAGPVKLQNKALKRQYLMKKHNIPTHTSEGGRTVKIEQARGPRRSKHIPAKFITDDRGRIQIKEGTGVHMPAVKRTDAQNAQEKGIAKARQEEKGLVRWRGSYRYGEKEKNRENLNIKITNQEKTKPLHNELTNYRGAKHIKTRSGLRSLRDSLWYDTNTLKSVKNDPYQMGLIHPEVKLKGLE